MLPRFSDWVLAKAVMNWSAKAYESSLELLRQILMYLIFSMFFWEILGYG